LFTQGDWKEIEAANEVYAYERTFGKEKGAVYCNFSESEQPLELKEEWSSEEIVLQTGKVKIADQKLILPPYSACVFVANIEE
jgi:hypothetical protein